MLDFIICNMAKVVANQILKKTIEFRDSSCKIVEVIGN